MISAKMITDSLSPQGKRLSTLGFNIKDMAKLHKRLLKEEEKEEITNLVKGRLVQVEIENGVLIEIK